MFYPPVIRARELIAEDAIGTPLSIRIKSNPGRSATAWDVPASAIAWRQRPEHAGGGPLVFDDGHHKFALAWHFMGEPEEVHAFIGETETADHRERLDAPSIVSFRFPGNRIGNLEIVHSPELEIATRHYAQDDRVEITGSKGVLWLNGGHGRLADAPPVALYRDGALTEFRDVATGWEQSFVLSTRHFLEALKQGGRPVLTAREGRQVLRFALAAPRVRSGGQAGTGRCRGRNERMTNTAGAPGPLPPSMDGRAAWLAAAGGLNAAIDAGRLGEPVALPLAEALVLGLMRQGVTKYLAIFGHGSTTVGEVLRVYQTHGLVRCWQFRNEVAMAHAATALRWVYGEPSAVVTSIGPGAMQALAGSLAAASNGVGVYHLYGDETTHGEGYNMQQVPKPAQGLFGQMTALMGESWTLHSPGGLRAALRRGAMTVFHPWKAGPFYLNLPLNTQPAETLIRLDTLPAAPAFTPAAPADENAYAEAAALVAGARRVAVKAGGGARPFAREIREFAERAGAAVVLSPGSTGVLPDGHPQNLHVGGSKGSISGNFAMEEADLLVVIGSRAVCQSDCSGTGWPKVATSSTSTPIRRTSSTTTARLRCAAMPVRCWSA